MESPRGLSPGEFVRIAYAFLFVILGVIILVRGLLRGGGEMVVIVGGGFVALGAYRVGWALWYLLRRQSEGRAHVRK